MHYTSQSARPVAAMAGQLAQLLPRPASLVAITDDPLANVVSLSRPAECGHALVVLDRHYELINRWCYILVLVLIPRVNAFKFPLSPCIIV